MSGDDSVASAFSQASGTFSMSSEECNLATKGTGKKASEAGAELVELLVASCRARVVASGVLMCCGNASNCGRPGHDKLVAAGDVGPPGFYKPGVQGRFMSAKAGACCALEEISALQQARLDENRAAVEELTVRKAINSTQYTKINMNLFGIPASFAMCQQTIIQLFTKVKTIVLTEPKRFVMIAEFVAWAVISLTFFLYDSNDLNMNSKSMASVSALPFLIHTVKDDASWGRPNTIAWIARVFMEHSLPMRWSAGFTAAAFSVWAYCNNHKKPWHPVVVMYAVILFLCVDQCGFPLVSGVSRVASSCDGY